jgi:8-oxo-dGTP pyrophosphatase MutT (NUDIX family)
MDLLENLRRHRPDDAAETADLRRIVEFVAAHPDPFDRRIAHAHLTASAFVISDDGARVLLLHHLKLDRWLQPGGHGESGEEHGEDVALREAVEETGIGALSLHPVAPRPLDVDVHAIPARGGEAGHFHLDLRYLVTAPGDAACVHRPEESSALRWFGWEELDGLGLDAGLQRGLAKARRFFSRA